VQPVGLDDLLQRSDIISMHAPGTKDAHHLLKEPHFKKMKKTALFVNTGRGSTVDESAMIKALAGRLDRRRRARRARDRAGRPQQSAARDGQRHPHLARRLGVEPLRQARKRRVGAELSLVLSGKWPRACVNPTVLEKSKLERWQPFSMERGPGN